MKQKQKKEAADEYVSLKDFIKKIYLFVEDYCDSSVPLKWNAVNFNQQPYLDMIGRNIDKLKTSNNHIISEYPELPITTYEIIHKEKDRDSFIWEIILHTQNNADYKCIFDVRCGNISNDLTASCFIDTSN